MQFCTVYNLLTARQTVPNSAVLYCLQSPHCTANCSELCNSVLFTISSLHSKLFRTLQFLYCLQSPHCTANCSELCNSVLFTISSLHSKLFRTLQFCTVYNLLTAQQTVPNSAILYCLQSPHCTANCSELCNSVLFTISSLHSKLFRTLQFCTVYNLLTAQQTVPNSAILYCLQSPHCTANCSELCNSVLFTIFSLHSKLFRTMQFCTVYNLLTAQQTVPNPYAQVARAQSCAAHQVFITCSMPYTT